MAEVFGETGDLEKMNGTSSNPAVLVPVPAVIVKKEEEVSLLPFLSLLGPFL